MTDGEERLLAIARKLQEANEGVCAAYAALNTLVQALILTHPDLKALIDAHASQLDALMDSPAGRALPGAIAIAQADQHKLLRTMNLRDGAPRSPC